MWLIYKYYAGAVYLLYSNNVEFIWVLCGRSVHTIFNQIRSYMGTVCVVQYIQALGTIYGYCVGALCVVYSSCIGHIWVLCGCCMCTLFMFYRSYIGTAGVLN